jgi:hypothetical protein
MFYSQCCRMAEAETPDASQRGAEDACAAAPVQRYAAQMVQTPSEFFVRPSQPAARRAAFFFFPQVQR